MMKVDRKDAAQTIKDAVDIVDVISSAIDLKKKGRNYSACCPFHSEKTPSFMVSQSKQYFKCFGCGKSGDVFTFVQDYYGKSFVEALDFLAEQAKIEIVGSYGDNKTQERKRLQKLNRDAAEFFFRMLWKKGSDGYKYMQERGAERQALRDFAVGYAPWDEDGLYKFLKDKGYTEDEMVQAQVVKIYDGKAKDFFRNRIIFPIRDVSGKFIAFGGRDVLKPGEKGHDMRPKYLNTSDYFLFKKSKVIYGLFQAREEISKTGQAILVEGYMDVLALHQHGLKNAVASMGTAFTEEQAALLKKFARKVYLCYDSDDAGINAAVRGGMELKRQGFMVKVIHVTDGKDPDEFLKSHGKRSFLELMEKAEDYETFCIGNMAKDTDFKDSQSSVSFIRNVAAFLSKFDPAEHDVYAKQTASRFPVSELAIKNQIETYERTGTIKTVSQEANEAKQRREEDISLAHLDKDEALALNMMYRNGEIRNRILEEEVRDIFHSQVAKEMVRIIERIISEGFEIVDDNILKEIKDQSIREVIRTDILERSPIREDNNLVLDELVLSNKIRLLDEEIKKTQTELDMGQDLMSDQELKDTMGKLADLLMEKSRAQNKKGL